MRNMTDKKQLIKALHILMNRCNISEDDRRVIYAQYGAESSKEMAAEELMELMDKLHELLQRDGKEQRSGRAKSPKERAQTSCKVAIGKLLAAQGKIAQSGWGLAEWNLITKTACRAAGVDAFRQIPLSKLRGITFEFNNQKKAIEQSRQVITQKTETL